MFQVDSLLSPLSAAAPPFWYALAALLALTPLYFLLTGPRKKRPHSKWKG